MSFTLWTHDASVHVADGIFNTDLLPEYDPVVQLLLLYPVSKCSHRIPRIVISPAALTAEMKRKTPNLQISLSVPLASVIHLNPRSLVNVEVRNKNDFDADYMVLFFKDQYINRSDMWMAACTLQGQCVYVGKKVTFAGGLRADVREIRRKGKKVFSAYVSANTKPVFRSESARYLIFLQMSKV